MRPGVLPSIVFALGLAGALLSGACGRLLQEEYEYEEELYLSLDGSATLNVNASIPALVALRGADLDLNPRARLDRRTVRALFESPGVEVSRISDSRREGRRFVHVGLEVDDVRQLPRAGPFSWSTYELQDRGDVVEYRQVVTSAAARPVGDVGWTGEELVAFRIHIPSEIPFHNSPAPPQRGNILEWEQPLTDRLKSVPIEVRVTMEAQSILYSTLVLFGGTIVAAAATFAIVIWWVARKGRDSAAAESVP
jgi:hypothetical protein